MIAIRAGQILTPLDSVAPGVIIVENGRIKSVEPDQGQPLDGYEIIQVPECTLGPGLIDVHTHGIGGLQIFDGRVEDLELMSQEYARHGVTGFLTGVAGSSEPIQEGLTAASQSDPTGAELLGIHLEGPFINPARPGAFPPESIVPPNLTLLKKYIELATGKIRLITLAPELDGALDLVRFARQAGVICSAGHTQATWDEMMAAIDAGISHVTHTFNAMPALNHRLPGILGAALSDNRLMVEIIADGIHVHPAVIKMLLRCKGVQRVIAISDSIAAAGMPDGKYEFEGLDVTVANGSARLNDGTLAGSISTLEKGLINLVHFGGISLADAFRIASHNPAIELGLSDRKGNLKSGMDADIICVDKNLVLQWTMARGHLFQAN